MLANNSPLSTHTSSNRASVTNPDFLIANLLYAFFKQVMDRSLAGILKSLVLSLTIILDPPL